MAFCCEPRECDLDSLSSAVGLLPGCRVVLNFPLVLVTSHQAGPWQETGQMAAEHSTGGPELGWGPLGSDDSVKSSTKASAPPSFSPSF